MARGRPKSDIAPCRFCKKHFKRLEHLQRHERIRMLLFFQIDPELLVRFETNLIQIHGKNLSFVSVDVNFLGSKLYLIDPICI